MSRLFKIIAVLVALPVLGVISLLLILDNPTVYQEPIGDAFRQKTGLELNFNGDIQWRFFPPLAININEIEIKSPDSDTPLASLNSASIDLKLIPIILEGKIVIEAIEIDGVDLNCRCFRAGYWQLGKTRYRRFTTTCSTIKFGTRSRNRIRNRTRQSGP